MFGQAFKKTNRVSRKALLTYSSRKTVAYFCLLIGITGIVYLPGLSGGFYFDDEWNILSNDALKLNELSLGSLKHAAESGQAGPLGRPLAMLSFAVNYYLSGFNPFFYKLTNLIIHLITGLGIYLLTLGINKYLIIDARKQKQLAFFVGALWLLHPLNLTPVLYVVQRMTGLSALFCFWGLASYVYGRNALLLGEGRGYFFLIAAFGFFLPLALLSKENAALFPLYCFLIELIFFQFKSSNMKDRKGLVLLYVAILLVPAVFLILYVAVKPHLILNSYVIRDFSLTERLLTEARIVVFYLKQVILPFNNELGLFHDDIPISISAFKPISTLYALIFIALLLISSIVLVKKMPVYSFGILFFFSAHLMESTVLGLELVHEHRNYVAIYSIEFMLAYYLMSVANNASYMKILYGFAFVVLFYFGFSTFLRASIWGDPTLHAFEELRNHENSPRVNYQVGRLFSTFAHEQDDIKRKEEAIEKAIYYFEKSAELSESYTDGLFGLLMIEGIEGEAMEEKQYQSLLARLANGPFNNNNYNYLSALFRCMKKGVCRMDPRRVEMVVEACKKNQFFTGQNKVNILTQYSNARRMVGS